MLKKSFMNKLKKIMAHNNYGSDWLYVSTCEEHDKWTPVDLVIREYLNNGGGSAKGFLGIYPYECRDLYHYICENKEEIINLNMVSESGWNNSGFPLWDNYDFDGR